MCTDATNTVTPYGTCVRNAISMGSFTPMAAPPPMNTTCEDACFTANNLPNCVSALTPVRQQKLACMATIPSFNGCPTTVATPSAAPLGKPNFANPALGQCMRMCKHQGGFGGGFGGGARPTNTIHTCSKSSQCRCPMPDCMATVMAAKTLALTACNAILG